MTAAPLILVVADRRVLTSGAWVDVENVSLPYSYVAAVEQAGGVAVLVPPTETAIAGVDRLLAIADGVFLAGGRDIAAESYGQTGHALNDVPLPERDELEVHLVRGARERGLPVLGACRGMQALNVACGGTLVQHLGDHGDLTPHRDVVGTFTEHAVRVVPGSVLAALSPADVRIASHHHQAVDRVGDGLVVSARADDGVIEAIENPADRFTVGVQWHPEERLDPEGARLFDGFVAAATEYHRSRATASAASVR